MIYRNIYSYHLKRFKNKLFKNKMTIENGPFVTSVKIGLKTKIKKDGQDAVTSSYKTLFSCKE